MMFNWSGKASEALGQMAERIAYRLNGDAFAPMINSMDFQQSIQVLLPVLRQHNQSLSSKHICRKLTKSRKDIG